MRTDGDQHLDALAHKVATLIANKEQEVVLRLCTAAAHGDLRQLRQLMQSGVDPNAGDFDGRRPLVSLNSATSWDQTFVGCRFAI